MIWLSKQPSWSQTREVQVSTRAFGLNGNDKVDDDNRKITFLPALFSTYSLWYKGRWMRITRTRVETGPSLLGTPRDTLQLW